MNQNNLHMIPQPVIDCAENLFTTKQDHLKQTYIARLETIRDYCEDVLKKASNPTRQVFDKKTKSQLNYSRIGRHNV